MRFLRTVRLDASDEQVFERAAAPGELAVAGSFAFLHDDAQSLRGKRLQAFSHGFLGVSSFGWSTLVEVAEIGDAQYKNVIERLAHHFVEHYGAPDVSSALPAAREEVEYAATLADQAEHTLLAIERALGEDGVIERLRVVRPPSAADHGQVRLWGPEE